MVSEKDILARDSSPFWASVGKVANRMQMATMPVFSSEVLQKRVCEAIDRRPSLIFFTFITKVKKIKLAGKGNGRFLRKIISTIL
jgi:hypothetical protein